MTTPTHLRPSIVGPQAHREAAFKAIIAAAAKPAPAGPTKLSGRAIEALFARLGRRTGPAALTFIAEGLRVLFDRVGRTWVRIERLPRTRGGGEYLLVQDTREDGLGAELEAPAAAGGVWVLGGPENVRELAWIGEE